jgi:uncharacterized protein
LDLEEQEGYFTEPIRVDYALERVGQQVVCRALVSTSLQMACSRCLKSVQVPISEEMTILIRFSSGHSVSGGSINGTPPTEYAGEETDQEVKTVSSDTDRIDVTEEIRQTLLLAIPVKPLCHDGCRGLCPQCGMDLNTGRCDCHIPTVDPRWSGLERMLRTTEGENGGCTEKKDLKIEKR